MIRPEELPRQATLGCTEPNEKGRTHRHGTPTANAAANCRCEHRRNAMSAYRAKRRAEWQRPAAQAASGGHRWAYPARQFPPQHPQRGDRALRYRPARHPQGRATHAWRLLAGFSPEFSTLVIPVTTAGGDRDRERIGRFAFGREMGGAGTARGGRFGVGDRV